jgi:hypothetical protein
MKIWVNGHEWAKQQARKIGFSFTELSNGFASAEDPALLQRICDALQPGTINVFFQRWLSRLPLPLGPADQRAGYWWELSMAQVEVSRTIVFAQPRCGTCVARRPPACLPLTRPTAVARMKRARPRSPRMGYLRLHRGLSGERMVSGWCYRRLPSGQRR